MTVLTISARKNSKQHYCPINNKMPLTVGETNDYKKNSVTNIVIQKINPLECLFASKRLSGCVGEAIKLLALTLQKFQIPTNQVLMFISDNESSMDKTSISVVTVDIEVIVIIVQVRAGSLLTNDCSNLIHVTFMLHLLNLAAVIHIFINSASSACA